MVSASILSSWIPNNKHCDVYCIALQECKDVSEEEIHLLQEFLSTSHPLNEKYILVASESVRTWTMLRPKARIITFARQSVAIKDVSHTSKLLNRGSSKGGVAVEFKMDGQYFCVVCAHFASKVQKLKARAEDFSAVYGQIIGDDYSHRSERQEEGISFNHIIFMGDLNYRIQLPGYDEECEDQFEEACDLIVEKNWDALIAADQLRQQLKSNPSLFPGFTEMHHRWAPTYCMEKAKNEYTSKKKIPAWKPSYEVMCLDTIMSCVTQPHFIFQVHLHSTARARTHTRTHTHVPRPQTPSYTDRILFRTGGRFLLVGDSYSCASNFFGSEHRPVNAIFHIHDTKRSAPSNETIVIPADSSTPHSAGFEFDVDSHPLPNHFDCGAYNGATKDDSWERSKTDKIDSFLKETELDTERDRCCSNLSSNCIVM